MGRTERGVAGQGGRFFLFFTGFPFPLGPLFSRQTVRYEVCLSQELPCRQKWTIQTPVLGALGQALCGAGMPAC